MPILGTIASSKLTVFPGDYESIATATVGAGGTAGVTFSSIPSTYTHLQLRGIARSNRAASSDTLFLQYNGDTGTNYSLHFYRTNGVTQGQFGAAANAATANDVLQIATDQSSSNIFGTFIVDLIDYSNTSKNKTMKSLGGFTNNTSAGGLISFASGGWRNTSAITSIFIDAHQTDIFLQYSQFALYGIRSN
jgi:hypothetical protein